MDHADGSPLKEALTVRIHRSLTAAERDLASTGLAGYAFSLFAWLQAWHATIGARAGVEVAVVVVADARVRLVLPLCVARRRGLRILEFMGAPASDYSAPLVEPAFAAAIDDAGMAVLWTRIASLLPRHDIVRFRSMPGRLEHPGGAGQPPVFNPLARIAGVAKAGRARSRRLPGTHAELAGALKRRFVNDTLRLQRRIGERGPLALSVARTERDMSEVLSALRGMKSRRWTETGGRDWFADADFSDFCAAMSRLRLPEGRVHGALLTVGGTPVAAHLGLLYRRRFYLLLVGWEAGDWRRYGTGRLMVDALMRCAIDEGASVFDFTGGEEAYKSNWADDELELLEVEQPASLLGAAALACARVHVLLRNRAKRIGWLRTAVRRSAGRPTPASEVRDD